MLFSFWKQTPNYTLLWFYHFPSLSLSIHPPRQGSPTRSPLPIAPPTFPSTEPPSPPVLGRQLGEEGLLPDPQPFPFGLQATHLKPDAKRQHVQQKGDKL